MATNIPLPSKASLAQQYVGKSLKDIPLPAAVLDIAAVKRNCKRMLDAMNELGWALRPVASGHETTEITRLQIGEDPEDVRLLVSTLSEAENLLPLLLEYQQKGLQVSVLYDFPISTSQVERIANISRILGKRGGNIRLLVDHEAQIPLLLKVFEISGYPPYVYIAIDAGSRHIGVRPGSPDLQNIFRQIEQLVLREGPIMIAFVGFYCQPCPDHNNPTKFGALAAFEDELIALLDGSLVEGIRLSVPETMVLNYLPQLLNEDIVADDLALGMESFKESMTIVNSRNHRIEVYASSYVLLDLKQLSASHVMIDANDPPSWIRLAQDMPLTILTEVTSLYPNRGVNDRAEALIAAGTSAFGPESDPSIGWGTVDPEIPPFDQGWYVQRADRESAVLVYGGIDDPGALQCGQRIKIHPYDATKASERFGWYFVVDSSRIDHGDEVVDIFVRWRD